MRVIHVLRKPLSEGTVAANTLKHGCGGLHIDASRVGTTDNLNGGAYAINPTHRAGEDMWTRDRKGDTNCFKRGGAGRSSLPGDTREGAAAGMFQPSSTVSSNFVQPTGRWPGNLILQHLDGCECVGVMKVSGGAYTGKKSERDGLNKGHDEIYGDYGSRSVVTHADEDGKDTVAHWVCVEGCPVARLDEDTVSLKVRGNRGPSMSSKVADVYGKLNAMGCGTEYNHDTDSAGGASRFFKQVGGKTE
jgi:hypothetical protein